MKLKKDNQIIELNITPKLAAIYVNSRGYEYVNDDVNDEILDLPDEPNVNDEMIITPDIQDTIKKTRRRRK